MTRNRWRGFGFSFFCLTAGLVSLALDPLNWGLAAHFAVFGLAGSIASGWPLWTEMWKRSVGKMDEKVRVLIFVNGGLALIIIAYILVPMPMRLILIAIGLIAIFASPWPIWEYFLGLLRKSKKPES
ncbi:MAG: hypothetical protein HYV90_05895 [Candidatus Woesebacteria bacterium]|nr:MAG: hypothetical protein HYV90_05895 [Candidatus Woesebacteria bacterium]